MSTSHDRHAPPRSRPPAAAELLPMLVWLNRRELASRFPAWQPPPGHHTGEAAPEPPLGPRRHADPR